MKANDNAPEDLKERNGDFMLIPQYESVKREFDTNLSSMYKLDNFICCEENMMAYSAAEAVAFETEVFNPLYFYGESGTGKTHLLHAIGNHILEHYPKMKIMYVTAEEYINDFTKESYKNNEYAIREKYRSLDVLLFDDIQLLAEDERIQKEFAYTVDSILRAGNQVVIAADNPPKKLKGYDRRIQKMLGMGLVTELHFPNPVSKENIVRVKAQERGVLLQEDVYKYIAEKCNSDVA